MNKKIIFQVCFFFNLLLVRNFILADQDSSYRSLTFEFKSVKACIWSKIDNILLRSQFKQYLSSMN